MKGYWLLVMGYRLLVMGYRLLVRGYRLLVRGYRLLATLEMYTHEGKDQLKRGEWFA